jgi:nifR3 family TIM-barrel protein
MLRDIPKMLDITRKVVNAVSLPVTAKTRLGWDCENKIICELGLQLQDCGIKALAIHGRTRSQMYTGEADWELIGKLKADPRMEIPVIGNGDIISAEKAADYFNRYGVDGIMVGRGAIGAPWIFKEIKTFLATGEMPVITNHEKLQLLRRQISESIERIDEYRGILHIRRHLAATPLFKGLDNFKPLRIRMLRAETHAELLDILNEIDLKYLN